MAMRYSVSNQLYIHVKVWNLYRMTFIYGIRMLVFLKKKNMFKPTEWFKQSQTYLLGLLESGSVTNRSPWKDALFPYSSILLENLGCFWVMTPGDFTSKASVFWQLGWYDLWKLSTQVSLPKPGSIVSSGRFERKPIFNNPNSLLINFSVSVCHTEIAGQYH